MLFPGETFAGGYERYFDFDTDNESLVYLMLANHVLHSYYPSFLVTVAEVRTVLL